MPWSSHERIAGAVLALLVAGAFALRLDGITNAPFELHATRQYHSALLARTIYLDGADNLPAWKERVLDALDEQETVIEPPVMEVLAVGGYHLAGGERLWIPRLLSSLWWVCGALLLYRVARRVAGPPGSLVAVAAYLFMPYAVLASRSFQPDPLMVVSIVAATLAMLRYHERPTDRRLSTAMLVCALALLVKPGVASPFVFAVFAFLAVQRAGLRRAVASSRHYIFAAAALPMFLYWGYGRYVADFLSGHVQDKLAPSLLSQWSFWNGWRLQLTHVLTYPRTEEVVAGVVAILCLVGVVTPVGARRARCCSRCGLVTLASA